MKNHIQKAKEIVAKGLKMPIESIADTAELTSLEQFDSMAFESIVLDIQDHVGHPVSAVSLIELKSIQDLAQLLQREKGKV
jgi:Phosphopantetheine attachment site.